MGKAKTIISGVSWSVAYNIISILYGIISVPFLINYFGKEMYGLIGIALSVNVYIALLDMGMTNTNIRFFSEYYAKNDNIKVQKLLSLTLWFYLIVGLLNTFFLLGFSLLVGEFFKINSEQVVVLRNLLWVLALNATFSWLSICFDQLLKAKLLISWIQKRNVILKILQFIVLILTIYYHFAIELYFFVYIFMATIILPLTIIKTREIDSNLKFKPKFNKEIVKTTMPYALSIFSFSIFQFIAFNFRPLFLGSISGPASVADFSILNTIASVVTVISTTFIQVLLPILTKMRLDGDEKGIQRMMLSGTKFVTILLGFIIFNLIVSMSEILTLYVGPDYVSLSKWAILWLLTLLLSHRNVMTSLVFTERNLSSIVIMGCIAMCIAIATYFIFVPRLGVGGVVIGFTIHELSHTLFYYFYFLPIHLKINTAKIFRTAVAPVCVLFATCCIFIKLFGNVMILSTLSNGIFKCLLLSSVLSILTWFILLNGEDRAMFHSLFIRNK